MTRWVILPYYLSLLLLGVSATLLVFTTCKIEAVLRNSSAR